MTIAFSHYSAENDISGVSTWLERLLLRLHARGVPMVVLLHHFGRHVNRSSILGPLQRAGIPIDIVSRGTSLARDVKNTLEYLNRRQPALFLPQCLSSMNIAAAIAGRQGLPWVFTMHSDSSEYWAPADFMPPESHGGTLVCVSHHLADRARELGLARNPRVIPCGVRRLSHPVNFAAQPFRVAFCGRIEEEQKRISLVVEAMALACQRDPRIECVIMGDGTALAGAKKRVDALRLGERIHFTGRLSPDRVQRELSRCQVILLMSDYEGLPVALVEAMGIGVVPVVRSIPSGVPELIRDGDTGLLVNETPGQAAAAIVRLLNDPQLWERCSLGARQRIDHDYGEDLSFQRWLKLIEKLARHNRNPYPINIPDKFEFPTNHPVLGAGYPSKIHRARRTLVEALRQGKRHLMRRFKITGRPSC